jgi:hypothetical protein
MDNILPNFLIVGAAKSGTTSLFQYLNQHPDIYLPEFKEPQFLVLDKIKGRVYKYAKSFDEYLSLFASAGSYKLRGEASVFYLYYYETAIENIKKYLGSDVKIIIILRDPVERAFSAYNHTLQNNPDENLKSFGAALNAEEGRMKADKVSPMLYYKSMGLYYESVAAFKQNFKNVLVLDYEGLIKHPDNMLKQVFDFLEVPAFQVDYSTIYNKGGKVWKSKVLKNIIKSRPAQAITKLIPRKLIKRLKTRLLTPIDKNVPDDVKKSLESYYAEDITKLVETEHQFKYWLKK